MRILPISGIIANYEMENESNVTPATLGKSLKDAGVEKIRITINSPGGDFFAGLEMFSLIQNYPGEVETRIVSFAASMGSILALAGNKKTIENTALYLIHNAQGIGRGDYRALLNRAEFLKDASALLANLYSEYTTLSIKEAQKLMDADSHFFGADLENLGFEIIQTGSEPNQAVARINAKTKFEDVKNKLSKEDQVYDQEKIAACLDYSKYGIKNKQDINTTGKKNLDISGINQNVNTDESNPAGAGKNNREVSNMTLEELKNENPELYNTIFQAGITKERSRVIAHMKLAEKTGAFKAAVKFITEGKSVLDEDVHAEYITAGMDRKDLENRLSENADDIETPENNDDKAHIDAFGKGISGEIDFGDEEVPA